MRVLLRTVVCWMFATAVALAHAQDAAPTRVLFVGNSYFYYNNSLHNHVRQLVEAANPDLGKRLQYKSATIGGASLEHHNIDWLTTPGQIGVAEPFQWVILAGNSADGLSVHSSAKLGETVKRFDAVIRARGGVTALYMTPAYVPPHPRASADATEKIATTYQRIARDIGAPVIPVGLAFAEASRRHPELRLHDPHDNSHPSLLGTYLAACVVYSKLYAQPALGNAYIARGSIEPDVAAKLQAVADDVVRAAAK